MKKSVKIIIAILIVILIAGVSVFFLLNKEKTSITAEEFKTIMVDKGYTFVDVKQQFAIYDFIEKAYIALKDKDYQIEFYETSDNESAIYLYNHNMSLAENKKTSGHIRTTMQGKNYSEYTLISEGKYKYISRINNTMVYVDVDTEYQEEVKEILKELGY